jgi:hypothetical protein
MNATVSYVPGLVGSTYVPSSVSSQSSWLKPGQVLWGSDRDSMKAHILVPGVEVTTVIPVAVSQAATSDVRCTKPKTMLAPPGSSKAIGANGTRSNSSSTNTTVASAAAATDEGASTIASTNATAAANDATTSNSTATSSGNLTSSADPNSSILSTMGLSLNADSDCSTMLVMVPAPQGQSPPRARAAMNALLCFRAVLC